MLNLQNDTKKNVLSENKKQPSSLPPVRNPFKAPGKTDKSSEWKKIHDGEANKGGEKALEKSVESEHPKKSNRDDIHKKKKEKEPDSQRNFSGANAEEGEEMSAVCSESWRDKKLPPGIKIKKRSSDEDKKLHSSGEVTARGAEATGGSCNKSKRESVNKQQTEKESKSESPRNRDIEQKEAPKQSSKQKTDGSNPHLKTDAQPGNFSKNSPKTNSQLSPGSTLEGVSGSPKPAVNSAQKKIVKSPFGDWSDEDDDVQLVSVQPGPQRTSSVPAAPLQKTLTTYPGFQLASKGKSQEEDPKAVHNHLTAQLKQKKVMLVRIIRFLYFHFFMLLNDSNII